MNRVSVTNGNYSRVDAYCHQSESNVLWFKDSQEKEIILLIQLSIKDLSIFFFSFIQLTGFFFK